MQLMSHDTDWMLNITMFQCSNVPIFQCSSVSMFQCSNISLVHWSTGQLVHWSIGWMSNVKCQMLIRLNFCQSLPPERLRSFLSSNAGYFFWLFDSLLGTHIHGKCPHNKSGFIFIINCSPRMVSLVFSFLDLLDALVNISCNSINVFFTKVWTCTYIYI